MASSSEDISGASATQTAVTEDEQKDKKKKFRPLEKMRKFFKSSKKSSKTKDSDKAKSTGALHKEAEQSEDDDDGGFARLPMGGTRSISEDSVFKPEQKEGGLDPLRQTAISMEQVNQQFKSELFSKLKRRTLSHSDEDDGLPQSPAPHVTTADLILGGGLKSTSTGKSTSRESDKSLLSVDGSENEEEDLFASDWKSSVASVKSPDDNSTSKEPSSMDFDFAAVKRDTQTLTSDAAKHRISVKPKSRKSSMVQSRRVADRATVPHLPRVTEEPTKQSEDSIPPQDHRTSIKVTAQPIVDELPKDTKVESTTATGRERKSSVGKSEPQKSVDKDNGNKEKSQLFTRNISVKDKDSEKIAERKSDPVLNVEEVKTVKPRPKSLVDVEPVESRGEANELSKAFKRMSLRREVVSPVETFGKTAVEPVKEVKEINVSGAATSEPKTAKVPVKTEQQTTKAVETKSPTSPTSKNVPTTGKTTYVLKKEPLRASSSTSRTSDYENLQNVKFNKIETSPSSDYENFPLGGLKSEKSELSSPEPDYDNLPPTAYLVSPTAEKILPKEVDSASKPKTSSMPQKLSSPREEYKLKRQPRSRTLPEQPVSREILDSKSTGAPKEIMDSKAFNVGDTSVTPSKRTPSKTNSFKENNNSVLNRFSGSLNSSLSEKTAENKIDIESTAKKVEPQRTSLKAGSGVSTTPSWVKSQPSEEVNKHTGSEQTTPSVVKSDSQDKPKFGQLRPVSTNKPKEKETPEPSTKKPTQEMKKEPDLSQKPPLATKPAELRSSTLDRKAVFENSSSSTPSPTVPAWKANLPPKRGSVIKDKEVKIEIIEKDKIPAKVEEQKKTPSVQLRGKPPCAEESKAGRKSGNVLDMVKNFQSMQAT
ncbi:muscle M-line assembly protein unc-89-like isoform X1 [Crassostrea angulata]|uniref:muscle M-line assembly protein unc-89-like isoform X1 n=1 Tax=Magallana angulata TaxID=2784310 RepID=UPI0022B13FE5|nr:muscle M-line assembly protein unc-89-like isoform X1 [Crassostrea angulata]